MVTYGSGLSGGVGQVRSQLRAAAGSQIQQLAQQLADDIVRERDAVRAQSNNGRIFTTFDPTQDILSNNVATQSGQTEAQNSYFHNVLNANNITQFSVAYGHFAGSGSKDTTGNLNNDTPTRAIYKQYAQLLLEPNDKKFTFDGVDSDSIYIINFNRSRFKEKIDPGNIEINIGALSGSGHANINHTGSHVHLRGDDFVLHLIDDSSTQAGTV